MFLDKMDIKIEFDDHLVKEQDHLDKKYWFYIAVVLRLFEDVNPWFWTKIGNVLFVFFKQNKPGNNVSWSPC